MHVLLALLLRQTVVAMFLGAAMEELYPEIQLADGPPRANGVFYYEAFFESGRTLEQAALKECEMLARKIAKQDHKFERLELTEAEALALFPENAFKQHFVQQALRRNPNALLTAYRKLLCRFQPKHYVLMLFHIFVDYTIRSHCTLIRTFKKKGCGPFVDFCAGPHLPSTKRAKSFILTRSGSHEWTSSGLDGDPGETVAAKSRGGLTLQRVYGVAKTSSEALAAWQAEQKILQQRSHRMIGQKQHLFMLHRSSPGGPFFLPHGVKILRALKAMLRCEYEQGGYDEVVTPLVYSKALWEQSGHWDHYSDDMYFVSGGVHAFEGGEVLETGLKPMSCPAHCLVYRHTERSWRSLPLRIADFTALHRNESSGALSGLTRVRQFHQDDGHIFCTDGQVGDEVRRLLELVDRVYTRFGFDYELKLSTRPEKSMGDDESWENAEACLRDALDVPPSLSPASPRQCTVYHSFLAVQCHRAPVLVRQHGLMIVSQTLSE